MKCKKLIADLTRLIIEKLLNDENSPHFYLDSIEFANADLTAACEEKLVNIFLEMTDDTRNFLHKLPAKNFAKILSNDDLKIDHENQLIEHVREFIKTRSAVKSKKP